MNSTRRGAGRSRTGSVSARAVGGVVLGWALQGCLPTAGLAASVPWTPSVSARSAIESLVDDAGLALTVSQWPLPREAVQRALDALPPQLPPALDAARAQVQGELRSSQAARIALTLRERREALAGFGDDATPGSSLQLRSGEFDGPHLAMQLGGRLDPVADSGSARPTARLDDSAVAVDAFGIQAQAWAHRSWWGPGWQSALPLSNNAPPLDGIGFQRADVAPSTSPWLSWLGPWNMDFFLARTEGEASGPGSNSLITGLRLTARPLPLVELGLTRMAQFGGQGHPETLGSFARAVVGSHANAQTEAARSRDSGNGLAGIDVRIRCPGAVRCAAYTQVMGEDDRKHLPYKYLEVLGTEVWSPDGTTRLYFEAAEIGCRQTWRDPAVRGCAYLNYAYPDGYTDGNRWLGASVGSDGKLLTLGWIDADWRSAVRLDYGHVGSRLGVFGPDLPRASPVWALSARRTWQWGATSLTPQFDWNRVATSQGVRATSRVGLEMAMSLDDPGPASANRFADALATAGDSQTTSRLLAATALVGGAALFDRAAGSYAYQHHNEPALKVLRRGGSALPYAEFGLASAAWLARRGSSDGDVALASVESGVAAVALAEAIKIAVDRSRPLEGRGAADFGHEKRSDSSFPSESTALAWAVLTPIAQRYDAPWLYGVAALTNAARVAGRNHWVSDTVAGAVLGYVVGDWFGKRADASGAAPSSSVMLMPRGIAVATSFY